MGRVYGSYGAHISLLEAPPKSQPFVHVFLRDSVNVAESGCGQGRWRNCSWNKSTQSGTTQPVSKHRKVRSTLID
jgi:hypothetical protein